MTPFDLISVIIPAYNHERYVKETIESILAQTYPNIELIIANDGSTDKTHDQIEALIPRCKERFTRVEYINKTNEGVIKSLNKCLSLASGSYVYFIASDDAAEPEAIEILHKFLSQHSNYGLAVGDDTIIDSNSKQCYWGRKQETLYDKNDAYALTVADYIQKRNPELDLNSSNFGSYEHLLQGNHVPNGFLIRQSILDTIGGYSEIAPLEDLHLMLQIAKLTKLKYINQPLFRYRWHGNNTILQRERMKDYLRQMLAFETAYAKKHGVLELIPTEKALTFLGLKIFEVKRSQPRTKVLFCKVCIYKKSIKKDKRITSILGIPLYKKDLSQTAVATQEQRIQ